MLELSPHDQPQYTLGFGGDTLNTAIYFARLGGNVDFITALGDDHLSSNMINAWQQEGVGTEYVMRKANALRVGRPFSSFIGPGIPDILAQNDFRRAAALGDFLAWLALTGGFKFMPSRFALRRPASFNPPFGFFPAERCQAGVLKAPPPFANFFQPAQSPLQFIK